MLLDILKANPNDAAIITSIFTTLISNGNNNAIDYALERILEVSNDGKNRSNILNVSHLLMELTPRKSWKTIWHLVQSDSGFGKELMERATHSTFGNLKLALELNEIELRDLYNWMVAQYPFASSQPHMAGPVSHVFTAERFRDGLLQRLISYGTPKSLEILSDLRRKQKNLPWDYYIAQAEQQYRLLSWDIPDSKDILKLAAAAEKRIVNNADQLIEVIEEALKNIQRKLHAETGSVIELWNYSSGKQRKYWPKDENDFSNWLKRQLETEIKTKRIVLAREVEIRRRVKRGERSDIYVAAKSPIDNRLIAVIVEVKGCWHPEIKDAMETQLAKRYLSENFYDHGIYVVGWFACGMWIPSDIRRKQTKFPTISAARRYLNKQARSLSAGSHVVRAVVIDAALR
jgi:hypothetical protein